MIQTVRLLLTHKVTFMIVYAALVKVRVNQSYMIDVPDQRTMTHRANIVSVYLHYSLHYNFLLDLTHKHCWHQHKMSVRCIVIALPRYKQAGT